MSRVSAAVLTVVVLLAMGSATDAAPITVGDFSPSANLVSFDSLAQYTTVTNQFAGLGVTFSGPNVVVYDGGAGKQDLSITGTLELDFAPALAEISRVGLDFTAAPGQTIFLELYKAGGTLLETVSLTATSGFLGIQTPGAAVAYAKIHDGGYQFAIDNVRFESAVTPSPEPSTLILASIFLGVGTIFVWRRQTLGRYA